MTISPSLITNIPLSTIESSIGDDAPPVFRGAPQKTGGNAKLGKIQTALLGSIDPVSTLDFAMRLWRSRPLSKDAACVESYRLLERDVERGNLVLPFGMTGPNLLCHTLTYVRSRLRSEKVNAFKQWLENVWLEDTASAEMRARG